MKFLKNNFVVKFTLALFLVGFIFGILYFTVTKPEITNYIENFKAIVISSKQNTYLTDLGTICLLFFLSISVIGLPLIFFINFYFGLSIGFTVCAFISYAKIKGLLFYSIFFIFSKIIFIVIFLYFMMICTKFVYNLILKLAKKEKENLYNLIINHFYRFIIVLGIILFNSSLIYFFGNKILSLFINWL